MDIQELAKKLNLTCKGKGDTEITGLKDLDRLSATAPPLEGIIYFVDSKKQLKLHPEVVNASCVLTSAKLSDNFTNAIIADNDQTKIVFIELLKHYRPNIEVKTSSEQSFIDPTAEIGDDCQIMPGAVVMANVKIAAGCTIYPGVVLEPHVTIGSNTIIYPNTVIRSYCVLGSDCIIHPCTVVGADGFGFHDQDGTRYKIPQIGNVVIGNNVELGSSCTIDRAAIESTTIGDNTKFDNQVHIAHNCRIGNNVYIAASTGIAGSTVVGNDCMIGGMVAIADHLNFCDGTIIMSMSGAIKDVTEPGVYFGIPIRPVRLQHKIHAALGDLPDAVRRLALLEASIEKEK